MVQLLNWIKQLEGKTNAERAEATKRLLSQQKTSYSTEAFSKGENIITKIPGKSSKEILAICHTDTFMNGPGANDNASGVIVLIDVLRKLKNYKPRHTIKIIFFGKEEITCDGSTAYVKKHGTENILAVLDLELVGRGDIVGIWPVTKALKDGKLLRSIHKSCKKLGLPFIDAGKITFFYGDFLPFQKAGLSQSVCLTLGPKEELDEVLKFVQGSRLMAFLRYVTRKIPNFFKHYHSKEDNSSYLQEADLQKMSNLVYETLIDLDNQLP